MGHRQPQLLDHRSVVAALGARIDAVLDPLIPVGSRCALLDFPDHSNVGDSAIWLGEQQWLNRRRCRIVYMCTADTYQKDILTQRLGDGIILLHGGGNLGDFWIEHQRLRELVIEEFPGNRIVQLPQTIYFQDESCRGEAARVFSGHRNLTVLCRDQASLDFAAHRFQCASRLCPDMAFAMGPIERPAEPQLGILWLGRTDAESRNQAPPPADDILCVDWLREPRTKLIRESEELLESFWKEPANRTVIADALMKTYHPLARQRVRRGAALLSRARVVVTDRLHGCILSLLLGIPHVALDNIYGKIRTFREAFLRDSALTHVAQTPLEALSVARSLLNASA